MAIISLRAYNREIEGLIDNGQLDEAVAHCRHILTTFPKYIASYRLLGKAHLEQQRISDATDIFQRVLSAVPDDFIANVGMSIIREDENNLDASIWHMELAYEAQPSNVAIQDELRRLYGRRDGMQPPKVRLTRGALARMYAKGGLFDQAIGELRAAISEDPNRPELQLLLAQMFFQISQRVDAVEECVSILKKLPFCLSANQILAVCLPGTDGSETSKNYRQIAISMDPYYAFASLEAISSDQVPENAVNIEKLEWKSGIQAPEVVAQPTWATSLGITLDKPAEETLPDWVKEAETPVEEKAVETPQTNVSPFIWDTQEVETIITDTSKSEGEIPDWMKDAGWKPASGETIQELGEVKTEPPPSEEAPQEELVKADFPEWLRGIAPEDKLEVKPPETQPQEKDGSIPWLEKQQPGPTDSIIQWLESKEPEKPVIPAETESPSVELTEEEIPEWLKDLDVPSIPVTQESKALEEIPSFPSVTPAFLEEPVYMESPKTMETEAIPSESSPVQEEETESITAPVEKSPTLEELAPEELPAAFADELPDWIKELAGELSKEAFIEATEGELNLESPAVEEEFVVEPQTFLEEAHQEESADVMTEEPVEEKEVPAEEMPSIETVEPVASLEIPEAEIQPLVESEVQYEQTLPAESELSVEAGNIPSDADTLTWLGDLTSQESTKNEDLVYPTEETEIAAPDWVKAEAEEIKEETIPESEQLEVLSPIPQEEIPEWIKGLGEIQDDEEPIDTVSSTSPEPEIPKAEELPSWLLELEQPKEEEEASGTPIEALEWKDEEQLPDWIKEISETTPSDEETLTLETPVEEEVAPVPSVPVAEWVPEAASLADITEEKSVEPQSKELEWTAEEEALEPPVTTLPLESEVVTVIEIEEPLPEGKEVPSAIFAEQPLAPVSEVPESELNTLENARHAITNGDTSQAVELYTGLITQNSQLESVLKDLQDAVYRFPVDVNLWVALGDAYFRTNELQEALNSYTKAEELVR